VAYHVVISPAAAGYLQVRLPEAVAWASYEFIHGPLADAPHRVGAPLRAPFDGHWRARRGEYRVRYTINEDGNEIHVLDVDHRRDIYRR
jgi:mRNA interferase RelE/StbE